MESTVKLGAHLNSVLQAVELSTPISLVLESIRRMSRYVCERHRIH